MKILSDRKRSSLLQKTTLLLMLLTVMTKIIGFLREIIISYYYGASSISDAYLIALSIPGSLFSVIGFGILNSYIPMYSKIEKDKGTKEADKFTNNIMNFILITIAVLVLFITLFTGNLVKLYASGFDAPTMELAVTFTRISAFGILFTGMVTIYTGYLNWKNSFLLPALMSLPFNFSIIAAIMISYHSNQFILPFGSVLAELLQFLLLFPFMYKKGFRHKPVLHLKDAKLRQLIKLSLPVMGGGLAGQINGLIDKTIASQIIIGGISSLNYAGRLNGIVQGIFTVSIATVLYPTLSRLVADQNPSELKEALRKAFLLITLFVLPSTVGLLLFARPIVILMFHRGAFDEKAISLTTSALFFYSVGMLAVGLREIISKAFYAMQDTRTPMINTMLGMSLNAVFSIVLSRLFGIGGLALAASTAAIITALLLFRSLHQKLGGLLQKETIIALVKILIASIVMGVSVRILYQNIVQNFGPTGALIGAAASGVLIYFILIYLMKLKDADRFIRKISSSFETEEKNDKETTDFLPYPQLLLEEHCDSNLPMQYPHAYVGIVLVTYNDKELLQQCLNYIFYQTYIYYKVFIIDNGSTDGTGEYVKMLQRRNYNLHYSRLNHNKLSVCYNYGIRTAKNSGVRYIWSLGTDMLPHRNALLVLMRRIYALNDRAFLISNLHCNLNPRELWHIHYNEPSLVKLDTFHFQNVFLPSAFLTAIGWQEDTVDLSFTESDFCCQMITLGYRLYQVRDSILRYN